MTVEKMQIPNFGRKELDVKHDSLDAETSGNSSRCFHFGLRELTTNGTPPDTVIMPWWADKAGQPYADVDESSNLLKGLIVFHKPHSLALVRAEKAGENVRMCLRRPFMLRHVT